MVTYYTVGGAVRDGLMGVRFKDLDFAVEAGSYEEMREDILRRGVEIFQERPQFASIRARDLDGRPADFTLCRRDGFYSDGRRPSSIEPGTIYDDLARRDFTVNAIAMRKDGTFIDPHGGIDDLSKLTLRCVGSARERFREDALRLLRAMRFQIVRGFDLAADVEVCLLDPKVVGALWGVSVERAYEELDRCYRHDTYATVRFFRRHEALESAVFESLGLGLRPRVESERKT